MMVGRDNNSPKGVVHATFVNVDEYKRIAQ